MRIHGLTVCVDFAAELSAGIDRWTAGLDSLTVVSTPGDAATASLCARRANVILHTTEIFYRDGASFNKGAAIAEAVDAGKLNCQDWVLLFDSDIVPPSNWRALVDATAPQAGNIYGVRRRQGSPQGGVIPDIDPAGYFLLFHGTDPNAQVRPLVDVRWAHAGNYDSTFVWRWPTNQRHWMPIVELSHIGLPGQNWFGKGNLAAMEQMRAERRRKGGWQHETISNR